jgi:hypothetical protein
MIVATARQQEADEHIFAAREEKPGGAESSFGSFNKDFPIPTEN